MYSLSFDTKQKLKDLFVCLSQEEIKIERLRQVLSSIPDFEPYAAFKRIDRCSTGNLTCKTICKYLRENGYRELEKDDMACMVRYFDSDEDMKLSYHDFLQILLPCDNAVLRADASQRPTFRIGKCDMLPVRVEQSLTTLLLREVKLQIKVENIKRVLESSYDFNIQAAFKVIDDWSYGYLDSRNLRRFLRNMGVLLTK
jgi:Ca2+-binding EF-hand superfamily protein